MRYLFFDTETTGLDPIKHNLLTAALIVTSENFTELGRLNLALKHEIYNVNPYASLVNKIGIAEHHNKSESKEEVEARLMSFLKYHTEDTDEKLVPVGQNVGFDVGFMQHNFPDWSKYVDYHKVDTVGIAFVLKIMKLLPSDQKLSLVNLTKFYNISHDKPHDAMSDCEATLELFKVLLKQLSGEANNV